MRKKKVSLKSIEKIVVEEINIDEIKPHPLNSQVYEMFDIPGLKDNIQEWGLIDPVLVIDQNNQLLSGARRLICLKELGCETVSIRRITVEDDLAGYYIYSFNRHRVKSFKEILNEIELLRQHYSVGRGKRTHLKNGNIKSDWRRLAAKDLGISPTKLDQIIQISNHADFVDAISDDKLTINYAFEQLCNRKKLKQSLDARIKIEHANYDGTDVKVYCQSSNNMSQLKDGEVKMIFTSVPYFDLRQYSDGSIKEMIGNEESASLYVENLVQHLDDCYRVLSDTGSFFLNINDVADKKNKTLQNLPHRVVLKLMERKGWKLRQTIIWSKTNSIPSSSKTKINNSYEFIFWLVKTDNYKYNPIMIPTESGKLVCTPPRRITKGEYISFTPMVSSGFKNIPDVWSEDFIETSVYYEKDKNATVSHPAVFNDRIMFFPMIMTTDPGDLILDPFAGSGTVLFSAQAHGRRSVGFDVQPIYVNDIIHRLNKGRLAA